MGIKAGREQDQLRLELLGGGKRVELAAAIQHYVENFHNHRRRHSALDTLTPTEYESRYKPTIAA